MKFIHFLTFILLFYFLVIPISARAIDEAQAADVNMAAQVTSPVSVENSLVQLNTQETLADPVNHPLLLTVTLLDKDQKPLAGREVIVTSNRGVVDVIEATAKLSPYLVHAAEILAIQTDKTDKEGSVQFRITSFIPGLAYLTITADNLIKLPLQTIKFSALPFPAEFVLSTSLIGTDKEWILYSTRVQEENLSLAQVEAKRLANPGAKIKINFWVFALFLLIIVGMPVFILLNFINLRKIRWMENEQTLLLKKMFPPNYNRQS